MFPEAKVICCVRDIAWIMDSLERQFRADAFENTALFNNPAERATVYTRLEALANANRLVGFPYHALREACWGDHAEHLLIVDYDLLVAQPADVMTLLYQFIGEEPFEHDFDAWNTTRPNSTRSWACAACIRCTPRSRRGPGRRSCRPTCSSAYQHGLLARPDQLQGVPPRQPAGRAAGGERPYERLRGGIKPWT